jgi:hypothetical protein
VNNTAIARKTLVIAIVIVQLIDIVLHAATHQLELLRVSSNLVILLWAAITVSGWLRPNLRLAALVSIAAYLVLNLIFLALYGITNPAQGGALRVSLVVLIFATLALAGWFANLSGKTTTS